MINWYAEQILQHAKTLTQLVTELQRKKQELQEVWPEGSARDKAAEKTAAGIDSFLKSIQPMVSGAQTIAGTGKVVQASQAGMNSLAPTEQLVAALLSNPWTQTQGVATAATTVGMMSSMFKGLGTVFTALGKTQLGQIFTQLATVTSGVEQLHAAIDGSGSTNGTTSPTAFPTQPASYPTGSYPSSGYPGSQPTNGYPGSYPTSGYPGQSSSGYPGGMPASGYPAAYATGPDGLPYGYAIDPTTGNLMGTGYDPATGKPYGAGGLGDWVPVDIGSDTGGSGSVGSGAGSNGGGSGEANTGGGGSSGSTSGDSPTVVTVSSEGESVTFEVAATDPTTITATVGSNDSPSEVSITVTPSTA